MDWVINWEEKALKELKKLDKVHQKNILTFLNSRIAKLENPRASGKALSYDKHGLWRYRVQNFRIICRIDDAAITILIVKLGHRRAVYKK